MESKNRKSRYWTAVVYPESLPANWIDIIEKNGVVCAVSPLHDKDLNADKSKKKPHYHLLLCYRGPTTFNVVKAFVQDQLHGVIPEICANVGSMYRYFTHRDNPEKAQYDVNGIRCLNGFSISDYHQLTESELDAQFDELFKLIEQHQICEYRALYKFLSENSMTELKRLVRRNTIHVNAYLKSFKGMLKEEREKMNDL